MAHAYPSSGDEQLPDEAISTGQCLVGGGDMGELIQSMDWSATPLGPLDSWPNSLRTTVSLCLSSNFPINIVWGMGRKLQPDL
jgi:hypothetical protein